jgi:hypothetical protein
MTIPSRLQQHLLTNRTYITILKAIYSVFPFWLIIWTFYVEYSGMRGYLSIIDANQDYKCTHYCGTNSIGLSVLKVAVYLCTTRDTHI